MLPHHTCACVHSSRRWSSKTIHSVEPRDGFPRIARSEALPDAVEANDGARARLSAPSSIKDAVTIGNCTARCPLRSEVPPEKRGAFKGSEASLWGVKCTEGK